MKNVTILPNGKEILSLDEYRLRRRLVPRQQPQGNPENFLVRPPKEPQIMIIKKAESNPV